MSKANKTQICVAQKLCWLLPPSAIITFIMHQPILSHAFIDFFFHLDDQKYIHVYTIMKPRIFCTSISLVFTDQNEN